MMRNHNSRHGQWVYLFSSSVDTPLPPSPEERHTMTNYKALWVNIPENDSKYDQYPDESIEDWHKKRGLLGPSCMFCSVLNQICLKFCFPFFDWQKAWVSQTFFFVISQNLFIGQIKINRVPMWLGHIPWK